MKKKVFLHLFLLLLTTFLAFLWVNEETLEKYSLQLSGLLLLFFFFSYHLLRPPSFKLVESTLSTLAVLLLSQATGGLSSPFFFLNFLLLFELSLLLEPIIPFVLSWALIFFYFFSQKETQGLFLFQLLAFPLMTPLAYFLGKFYEKQKNQRVEIKKLTKEVENLKEKLLAEELKFSRENYEKI